MKSKHEIPGNKYKFITVPGGQLSPVYPPGDYLYEIRYDKTKLYGLESMWNKANHLITSCKNYSTEDMNLNFVFSQENDKINQWESFYTLLPGLLMHTIFVSDAIYR